MCSSWTESFVPPPCFQVACVQIQYTSAMRKEAGTLSTCTSFNKDFAQASWQRKTGNPDPPGFHITCSRKAQDISV